MYGRSTAAPHVRKIDRFERPHFRVFAPQSKNFPINHICPNGSTTPPCNILPIGFGPTTGYLCSFTSLCCFAPAATAFDCTASGSSTNNSILTVVNPTADGPFVPNSGDSVARKNRAPPIARPATMCPESPTVQYNSAPNAFL